MDATSYSRRSLHPTGRILTAQIVRLMDGYPREVRVGQPALVVVLAAAGVAGLLAGLVRALLSAGSGTGRRSFKELKKGPEYLVTPVRLRDGAGRLYEVELHGHLPQSALHPADHVQLTLRDQGDPDLAPKIERIVNLTTGQLLRPRTATMWSHLGPPLLLQAVLGVLVLATVAACAAVT
ncbi:MULTISPECIES: hypothetical protein [unclassified Micromonospora]|uniref:hypothetical protein n=1 Tax=unclassified Micromonospora TaxID=2617518 RepID=UPI0022B5F783|nr:MULTISPECIES: hypothetical protein [unclassified Micromonospora]MCZ7422456.1 hypothetical protein [Verrucosispora sp. WMMA2121]WBB90217.1 hypothetical protein O7597_25045 [Verrucosispora sp. WMMC514]